MEAYKTYVTLDNSKQVTLSDLPFQPGQRLEILVLVDEELIDNADSELVTRWKNLLKKMQTLHRDNPLTEEEIQAEIDAYRQGK